MQAFTELYYQLDESNRTNAKVLALANYFREAAPEDAVWALWFLVGNRFKTLVRRSHLREWVESLSGYPSWLVETCYERVGDSAETVSLLLPESGEATDLSLSEIITQHVQTLGDWDPMVQFQLLRELWPTMSRRQAFVFHKLLTGGFRVGVSKALVVRALSEVSGLEKDVIAHRLMGKWRPTARFYAALVSPEHGRGDISRPYPFYLATACEDPEDGLAAPLKDWQVEWKWDGIRAQLIKREGEIFLWSRGDESVTEQFPEIVQAAAYLENGTVLDGEILIWPGEAKQPAGFDVLQTRLGRKHVSAQVLRERPAVFQAYDLIERQGEDLRTQALSERRSALEDCIEKLPTGGALRISEIVRAPDWSHLRALWKTSRERGVEGFMLKRRASPYRSGRVKGDWWKWKVDPFTADLVMLYAQAGSGRRAGLYTDYTFGAWNGDKLVTVAKAYSGLTQAEIREVDRWIKKNTLASRGPVRTVPAELVFEVAFEGLRRSKRHKSGLAMRFPRIHRWRREKPAAEADTLETLEALLVE